MWIVNGRNPALNTTVREIGRLNRAVEFINKMSADSDGAIDLKLNSTGEIEVKFEICFQ